MALAIHDILVLIEGKTGTKPVKSRTGYFSRCPAHDDKQPSLSIDEGTNAILLKCHAGCTFDKIASSLGINAADLFTENGTRSSKFTVSKGYQYRSASGELLYEVCRLEPKGFRQRRLDPATGEFIWNLKGITPVPFRLPELIKAIKEGETVFIAEGEKDAEALVKNGFTATCNSGGAGKWRKEFAEYFEGAKAVVVIADKDGPGRNHAEAVAASLHPKIASIKIIEVPDSESHQSKDAHDFFAAGGTAEQLREIVQAATEFKATHRTRTKANVEAAEGVTEHGVVRLADETRIETVPLYFYADRSRWYAPDRQGGFLQFSESQAKSFIAEYGFSKRISDAQGNTPAERALIWKMQNAAVAYAGELAGYPAGCHEISGAKILVTRALHPIRPNAGEIPTISRLLQSLFADANHDQMTYFLLWLSKSYAAFLERFDNPSGVQFRHSPALYIAGPRKCGKTALIDLILTPLFGGRQADPMNYLREGKFNKELFGAALLVLDDKGASGNLAERRQRGEAIKDLIWKPEQRMEGKGVDAIRLRPFWRLVMAGNDDDSGLQVCPALSPSLEDKILMLRARQAEGLPTTHEENNAWASAIANELPAFAYFLLNWQPPAGIKLDERTRVANFWHPRVVSALRELQPEIRLLELIETFDLIGADAPLWHGTSTEFEQAMNAKDTEGLLTRFFTNGTAAGRMLTELSRMLPERVQKTDRDGTSFYRIFRAQRRSRIEPNL